MKTDRFLSDLTACINESTIVKNEENRWFFFKPKLFFLQMTLSVNQTVYGSDNLAFSFPKSRIVFKIYGTNGGVIATKTRS